MVRVLSHTDKQAIGQAIAEAERRTAAEIVTVIAPASDAYQSYILLYGLIVGSAIATGLWGTKTVTAFPLLLVIQIAAMALLSFIPWLRHACIRLVPKRILYHRAAHRAYEEYLSVSRHVSAATPIVLLYVSVAEHYAHILTSRSVREKIPDKTWNAVIQEFTVSVKKSGLRAGCIGAIQKITGLVIPHFPERGETHILGHHVIERIEG
jgi:putative membrane protein